MAHNEAISPVEGAAVLEALFHQSPTGLMVLDTELRILWINVNTAGADKSSAQVAAPVAGLGAAPDGRPVSSRVQDTAAS